MNEIIMQAVLMRWAMNSNHIYVCPNSTVIFPWESDLISVTKSLYTHEYEIKISLADYRKDAKKVRKHRDLQSGDIRNAPNYFWYATFDFDIDPPDHSGWIKVSYDAQRFQYSVDVKKEAPRLCLRKLGDGKLSQIAKLLSWRLANYYSRYIDERIDPVKLPEDSGRMPL